MTMPAAEPTRIAPLLRRLTSIATLTQEERAILAALPMTVQTFAPSQDIVRFGAHPTQSCLVLDGWACRYYVLRGGERQIVNAYIAGDLPDLQGLHLRRMDHSLGALTQTTVALIPHDSIRDMTVRFPGIAAALWSYSLIDAANLRERITSLGRRPALSRIAHLFCEFYLRLRAVGLADDLSYALPVRQSDLSDMLGLTSVHLSRTLQEMRRRNLASLTRRTLTIHDWDGLARTAEFDETYLHLEHPVA